MKIVVAYKWARDPQDATVGGDGTVDWGRAAAAVSEYDPVAVELGRRLADATGAELVGVSVGGADLASPMATKSALSRGFDRLVIVADDALVGIGTTPTALLLAEVVRHISDVDVVLTGDSSVDVGAQMVPAVLAGALGWPAVGGVAAVTATGDGTLGDLTVERAHDGGSQVLAVRGPAVLAAASDAVVPRVPGMKDILAAGKRPTERLELAALAAPAPTATPEVLATHRPALAARQGRVIDGTDPAAAAAELVAALRADALI